VRTPMSKRHNIFPILLKLFIPIIHNKINNKQLKIKKIKRERNNLAKYSYTPTSVTWPLPKKT